MKNKDTPPGKHPSRRFGWPLLVTVITILLLVSCFSALPPRVELFFNWPAADDFGIAEKSALWVIPATMLGAIYMLHLVRAPMIRREVPTERQARQRGASVGMMNMLALLVASSGLILVSASIGTALLGWQNARSILYPALPMLFVLVPIHELVRVVK